MDQDLVVGVDVGGTRIKAVSLRGEEVLDRLAVPSPADLASRFAEVVAEVVAALCDTPSLRPRAVGVVVPGLVDDASGLAIWSANLGWRDLDVPSTVSAHLGIPTTGGHDVRAGLVAEHRFGAAVGVDDVLFVPLGTGLASALMVGGHVVSSTPWTGELGHVLVTPGGPTCGCGRSGCLEAIASAGAIGRRWREASGQEGDAQVVAELVRAGDAVARVVWTEAVDALAMVIAPIVAAAGTRRIVIGGGLVNAGPVLLDPLREALMGRLPEGVELDVVAAVLGEWAGAIGAATLAQSLPT
ncbi:MAG: ROK family protein [Ornithinibacter sp.]